MSEIDQSERYVPQYSTDECQKLEKFLCPLLEKVYWRENLLVAKALNNVRRIHALQTGTTQIELEKSTKYGLNIYANSFSYIMDKYMEPFLPNEQQEEFYRSLELVPGLSEELHALVLTELTPSQDDFERGLVRDSDTNFVTDMRQSNYRAIRQLIGTHSFRGLRAGVEPSSVDEFIGQFESQTEKFENLWLLPVSAEVGGFYQFLAMNDEMGEVFIAAQVIHSDLRRKSRPDLRN